MEFAVDAVGLDVVVGVIRHLAFHANLPVRVLFRRNHFAADDRRLGDYFRLIQVNGRTVVRRDNYAFLRPAVEAGRD